MRRRIDRHNDFGTIWSATTRNFYIYWATEQSYEPYDGEDEDGSIQRELDDGTLVMFHSKVWVEDGDGKEIASDYLGASVYRSGNVAQFIHDGYFMDMLRTVCEEARRFVHRTPLLREPAL
jgi:hypothetical protein